ncbi:spermidine/putrescine ABC transporter substrate-binding protein [Spiribacter halobius]|uniref:Spermidine/putrescine ABC transporter substrate-binding protein n=2 Tax=Sediminicurvatus halobius TaxID=2182432 RepID=A0A2U2N8W0_9GAMM|nr:spermidine/putrescine ABC transporter substrate-binding protein [Spiribacter halobius]
MLAATLALFGSADASGEASSPPRITIATWGGAYEAAQQAALFQPFTERTGIEVDIARYDGGLAELRAQHRRGEVAWDVVDMTMSDTLAACDEGLLQPLDADLPPPSPEGLPPGRDFIDGAFSRCGITHTVYTTVIAYDRRAFPGIRPRRVADLFDTDRFPGRRALQRAPFGNLEWALLSYGVPRQDLYPLLSTPRGIGLALRRLERIAPSAVWWEGGDEPVALLAKGEVVMATGYNGRFFHARAVEGAPIEILRDGQIQEYENWAIAAGAPNPGAARRFIRFATSTPALAEFARHLPYGPARESAMRRVSTHVSAGVDMQPYLPTHPINARNAIVKDVDWYARTHDRIRKTFNEWLAGIEGRAPGETVEGAGSTPADGAR